MNFLNRFKRKSKENGKPRVITYREYVEHGYAQHVENGLCRVYWDGSLFVDPGNLERIASQVLLAIAWDDEPVPPVIPPIKPSYDTVIE